MASPRALTGLAAPTPQPAIAASTPPVEPLLPLLPRPQRSPLTAPAARRGEPPDGARRSVDATASIADRLKRGHLHFRSITEALAADAKLGAKDPAIAAAAINFMLAHVEADSRDDLMAAAQRCNATRVLAQLRSGRMPTWSSTKWADGPQRISRLCKLNERLVITRGPKLRIREADGSNTDLRGHRLPVTVVVPFRDGLASGSMDRTIRLWLPIDGVCGWSIPLAGHKAPITAICVLDDATLVTGDEYGKLRVWQIVDKIWKSELLSGHAREIIGISRFGDGFVSASADGRVLRWQHTDTWTATPLRSPNDGKLVAMCACGSGVAIACGDQKVWVYTPGEEHPACLDVEARCLCAWGDRLLTGSESGSVCAWERVDGTWLHTVLRPWGESVYAIYPNADGFITIEADNGNVVDDASDDSVSVDDVGVAYMWQQPPAPGIANTAPVTLSQALQAGRMGAALRAWESGERPSAEEFAVAAGNPEKPLAQLAYCVGVDMRDDAGNTLVRAALDAGNPDVAAKHLLNGASCSDSDVQRGVFSEDSSVLAALLARGRVSPAAATCALQMNGGLGVVLHLLAWGFTELASELLENGWPLKEPTTKLDALVMNVLRRYATPKDPLPANITSGLAHVAAELGRAIAWEKQPYKAHAADVLRAWGVSPHALARYTAGRPVATWVPSQKPCQGTLAQKSAWLRETIPADGPAFTVTTSRERPGAGPWTNMDAPDDAINWRGKFKIVYAGEEGIDQGGLLRDWIYRVVQYLADPAQQLFAACEHDQGIIYPRADVTDLKTLRLLGRVLGKAVQIGCPTGVRLATPVLRQLIDGASTLADLAALDPAFANALWAMLETEGVAAWDNHFVTPDSVPLKPHGEDILVTDANKAEYVSLQVRHRVMTNMAPQLEALVTGFADTVPLQLLAKFSPQELQDLISGELSIDCAQWRACSETVFDAICGPRPDLVEWFWEIVTAWPEPKRKQLLRLVTSSPAAPAGGFANLTPKFKLHIDGHAMDPPRTPGAMPTVRLPTAHTCFNTLDLPPYDSREVLADSLERMLVEEGFNVI